MKFFDSIGLFAQRAVQPYRLIGRTLIAVNAVIFLVFLLLVLLRIFLQQPVCEDALVKAADGATVRVLTSCAGGGIFSTFSTNIIDNLAAGLIVAMVSSALLWLISPKLQVEEDIASLASWNIQEVLLTPLPQTKNYWFRGRSGRFMRSVVMPTLFEAGRRESQLRSFSMLLPDPTETSTLTAYSLYRNSLASETGKWDATRIQVEIIATILVAARFHGESHFFNASIFLKSDFALFRLDMCDTQLVMTREDPKWPAIVCSARSKFYASYHEEFRNESENAKKLDLSGIVVPDMIARPDINKLIADLGLQLTLADADCAAVIEAMEHPKLPYA